MLCRYLKGTCSSLIVIILSACVATEITFDFSTVPTPTYLSNVRISNIYYVEGNYEREICATIDQETFWVELEDFPDRQLLAISTIFVRIDGDISSDSYLVVPTISWVNTVFDTEGSAIGWYPEPFDYCFNIDHLTIGTHTATLEITALSDERYTYSWIINAD